MLEFIMTRDRNPTPELEASARANAFPTWCVANPIEAFALADASG